MSPSKKSLRATEQERADVARARRRWIRKQGLLDPARLVFIDEPAPSTSLVRLRGRCPRGERLGLSLPAGHWKPTPPLSTPGPTEVIPPPRARALLHGFVA